MITTKDIKLRSKATKGSYDNASLANRYIVFKTSDSGEPVTMVRILLPEEKSKELGKKYLTSTIKYTEKTPVDSYIERVRRKRDEIFQSITGETYSKDSLSRYRKTISTKASSELYGGIKVKKSAHQFAVHFKINEADHVSYFSAFSLASEDKAYILACRFVDELNNEPIQKDSAYLKYKSITYFPELTTPRFWDLVELCSTVKGNTKISMSGVELVAKVNQVGFFANTYNRLARKQERSFFNAIDIGEDKAFIAACRHKDKANGSVVLPDSEYLNLKPTGCLQSILEAVSK